jgi:hypothetical protein
MPNIYPSRKLARFVTVIACVIAAIATLFSFFGYSKGAAGNNPFEYFFPLGLLWTTTYMGTAIFRAGVDPEKFISDNSITEAGFFSRPFSRDEAATLLKMMYFIALPQVTATWVAAIAWSIWASLFRI